MATCSYLAKFSLTAYQYGLWFEQFPWQLYGCLSFKTPPGRQGCWETLEVYCKRLERKLQCGDIAMIAVLEDRLSGVGGYESGLHLHFCAAAAVPLSRQDLLEEAQATWTRYGESKIDPYDPQLPGCMYIAKTAAKESFDWRFRKIERLPQPRNRDLLLQQQADPYVPDHVRNRSRADTLTMRPAYGTHARSFEVSNDQPRPQTRIRGGNHATR